ncbi:MAG: tetratricopeptide repeat protein [Thermodesulfovibrionia bacterium]|nr:tetratricopeptide repeat protein [Thermodesulfovibrionia bacterium]
MSVSKHLKFLIGLVSILILPALGIAGDTKSVRQDTDILFVDFTNYYLSVRAQHIDINDLFKEISLKTGVRIIAESPIDYQISIDFKKKGFTRGMKLILSQLGADKYKGKLKLGKTFAGSIYTIRRISEQQISARREKASSFNSQGEKLLGEGKDYQAYHFFIKALRSDRNFLPAHKNLVSIYDLWEDYEKLSKRLEKVINLEPDVPQNYRLLADAYKLGYRQDKAIENYSRFITKSQKKVEVDKAKTIMAEMNTKKNRDYYQKISEARDLMRGRQFEHAREALSQTVDTDPSNTKAYELLAMVHEIGGDYETAIKWRKRLAGLAPDDPKNLFLLGRDFRILSRYQAASEYLTKAKLLSKSEYMTILVEKELELMK